MFWYENDVKALEATSKKINYKGSTIFYGSSTIRMWDTLSADLPDLEPVDLGFGGSTLAACVWFFDRIMQNYQPKKLVVYAGDNDLSDGRHPEELFIFFQQLAVVAKKRFGDMPCYFISLKPSISRFKIIGQYKYTNELIAKEIAAELPNWKFIDIFPAMLSPDGQPKKELYLEDGLHLSKQGYNLWKTIIGDKISADH
jgi:lysophospholipase L1-like esterase